MKSSQPTTLYHPTHSMITGALHHIVVLCEFVGVVCIINIISHVTLTIIFSVYTKRTISVAILITH